MATLRWLEDSVLYHERALGLLTQRIELPSTTSASKLAVKPFAVWGLHALRASQGPATIRRFMHESHREQKLLDQNQFSIAIVFEVVIDLMYALFFVVLCCSGVSLQYGSGQEQKVLIGTRTVPKNFKLTPMSRALARRSLILVSV